MLVLFLLIYYLSGVTCSGLLSRHRRAWIIDSFKIEEGNPGPFPYALDKIEIERQYSVYFELFGEGVDEEPVGLLSIDKDSGTVYVHKAVDFEKYELLKKELCIFSWTRGSCRRQGYKNITDDLLPLKFEARKADVSIDTVLGVEITILDINDNPPLFLNNLYEVSIAEEGTQGSHITTVAAFDRDKRGTLNSTFHYEIKSVSPNPPDAEFYIDKQFGTISFKGCLDHKVSDKFTVLVEAKDHGEVVSLSSSATVVIHVQDGNNHLPKISGQTGTGKVKEDESGSSPLRLHVTDMDTPNTPAWRVKYTIQGDEGKHFKIETDPDTNDGVLTVVKPLDFEEGAQRQLSISVENEVPYFFCKVKERTSSGLWNVDTSAGDGAGQPVTVNVLIEVEDVNDAPVFTVTNKEAVLSENAPLGTWVEKVTAVDPDASHAKDFVYKVGDDPAGWLTVDPHTGDITTIKALDRESPHVDDGVYIVTLHAVDEGTPPLTGTATLTIYVSDVNDNVPKPTAYDVDVCVSDSPNATNITAFDPDGNPFGGPFSFEVLGDAKEKWKLDPSHGYTAGLVMGPSVYTGPHILQLKISDVQGEFGIYNISVFACDCSVTPSCRSRRATATKPSFSAISIVFASLFLLGLMLLLAAAMSCKKEFSSLPADDICGETLLRSNTETPGTDCKLPYSSLGVSTDKKQHNQFEGQILHDGAQHKQISAKSVQQVMEENIYTHTAGYRRENQIYHFSEKWNKDWNYHMANGHYGTHQVEDMGTMNFHHGESSDYVSDSALLELLYRRLTFLKGTEEDLLSDYWPHHYADEGDLDNFSELESIINPDDESFPNALQDFGPEFNQLASICIPPQKQN